MNSDNRSCKNLRNRELWKKALQKGEKQKKESEKERKEQKCERKKREFKSRNGEKEKNLKCSKSVMSLKLNCRKCYRYRTQRVSPLLWNKVSGRGREGGREKKRGRKERRERERIKQKVLHFEKHVLKRYYYYYYEWVCPVYVSPLPPSGKEKYYKYFLPLLLLLLK